MLIVFLVIAVLVVIVAIGIKKTNERQAERMKLLSQEQLDNIKASGYTKYNGKDNLLTTAAVLTNVKESTSKKVPIDFIWWNGWTYRYEIGDSKIAAEKLESGTKVGDYITLVIKTKDGVVDSIKDII